MRFTLRGALVFPKQNFSKPWWRALWSARLTTNSSPTKGVGCSIRSHELRICHSQS